MPDSSTDVSCLVKAHIQEALDSPQKVPLFIGPEYTHDWILQNQPGIFIVHKSVIGPAKLTQQDSLIETYWHDLIDDASWEIELARIALQLLKLKINWCQSYQIYTIYPRKHHKQLIQVINQVAEAQKFHESLLPQYEKIRQSAATGTAISLVLEESQKLFLERSIKKDQTTVQKYVEISIMPNNELNSYQNIVSSLIQLFIRDKPASVSWLNHCLFSNLNSLLYLWLFFAKSQIATKPIYTDYFFQQSSHLTGGPYCHLAYQEWPLVQPVIKTIYQIDGFWDTPPNATIQNGFFNFVNPHFNEIPVLTEAVGFNCDIAVIHHTRLNCFKQPEINELFDLASLTPMQRPNTTAISILNFLLSDKDHLPLFISPLGYNHFIRFLHFTFYSQIKIRLALELLPALASTYRIKVYGEGWDQLLPKSISFFKPVSGEYLQNVYHRALLTLDLTPDYSDPTPNLNVFDCIQSGGVPAKYQTLFHLKTAEVLQIPRYQDIEDIYQLMNQLKDLTWRYDLNQKLREQSTSWHLQKGVLDNQKNTQQIHMPGTEISDFIKWAARGYVYYLLGYPEQAAICWEEALELDEYEPVRKRYKELRQYLKKKGI